MDRLTTGETGQELHIPQGYILPKDVTERLMEFSKNPLYYMNGLKESLELNKEYIITEVNAVKHAEEQEKRTIE